jgi:hypothetical protein
MTNIRFRILITAIALGSITSCQNNPNNNSENLQQRNANFGANKNAPAINQQTPASSVPMDFVKNFDGRIDTKYDITMKITANDGQISGMYFYKSQGKNLTVKGNIDASGNVNLTEYDAQGGVAGQFSGRMVNGNKIEGSWSKPGGGSSIPFYLIESNVNTNASQNNSTSSIDQVRQEAENLANGSWSYYNKHEKVTETFRFDTPRTENGKVVGMLYYSSPETTISHICATEIEYRYTMTTTGSFNWEIVGETCDGTIAETQGRTGTESYRFSNGGQTVTLTGKITSGGMLKSAVKTCTR